jgi:hypothetical protein
MPVTALAAVGYRFTLTSFIIFYYFLPRLTDPPVAPSVQLNARPLQDYKVNFCMQFHFLSRLRRCFAEIFRIAESLVENMSLVLLPTPLSCGKISVGFWKATAIEILNMM